MGKYNTDISSNIIREALDSLPTGVCYFDSKGIMVLCNHCMYELFQTILGNDIQWIYELEHMNENMCNGVKCVDNIYHLPNGEYWSFKSNNIVDEYGNEYTETIATNVTELIHKQKLLDKQNREQKEMVERMERIQENILQITREEEILNMKMKIHSDMGYNLRSIRYAYANKLKGDDKKSFIAGQRKVANILRKEAIHIDDEDSFEEFKRVASSIGVHIELSGEIPSDKEIVILLIKILREAVNNVLRHAKGDILYVDITYTDTINIIITNNGMKPVGEITEGGGLSSIRRYVENVGGSMKVVLSPRFELHIALLNI